MRTRDPRWWSAEGGRPVQRVEEWGTWASRTRKRGEAGGGRPQGGGAWAAKTVRRPRQQPAQPRCANYWAPLTHKRHPPQPVQPRHTNKWALRTRKQPSRSTGRSGRQNPATRRNMRREERVTVQGPVKTSNPMECHTGGGGDHPPPTISLPAATAFATALESPFRLLPLEAPARSPALNVFGNLLQFSCAPAVHFRFVVRDQPRAAGRSCARSAPHSAPTCSLQSGTESCDAASAPHALQHSTTKVLCLRNVAVQRSQRSSRVSLSASAQVPRD